MNVYEATVTRRSIRRFQDKPVPYEVLEKCIDSARLAPCGRNHQVCEYIVINDPEVLPGVFENLGGGVKMPPEKGGPRPENTPKAYTIILINKAWEEDNRRRITHYDVGMAAENIILVALEQGLGACPIIIFNESNLKPVLDIPESYDIALVIAMGYPAESPVVEVATDSVKGWLDDNMVRHLPKRKLDDIIHHNGF
jgi:nitroreductase